MAATLALFALLPTPVATCAAGAARAGLSNEGLSDEEYTVLSAFIDYETAGDVTLKRNTVVIVDRIAPSTTPVLDNPTALVDGTMITDLLTKSQREVRLRAHFRTRARCLLMSRKDSDHLPWEGGAPADPYLGILNLSRVGFNSDHSKAVIEFNYLFGNLGMEGGYVVLVHKSKKWSVVDKIVNVVS